MAQVVRDHGYFDVDSDVVWKTVTEACAAKCVHPNQRWIGIQYLVDGLAAREFLENQFDGDAGHRGQRARAMFESDRPCRAAGLRRLYLRPGSPKVGDHQQEAPTDCPRRTTALLHKLQEPKCSSHFLLNKSRLSGDPRRCSLCFVGHLAGRLSYYLNRSNDGKKKHSVGVKVATPFSYCELLYRLCGVNHVQDANAIAIAHTGLERSESLHL